MQCQTQLTKNCNTSAQKSTSMGRHTQQMTANQPRAKSPAIVDMSPPGSKKEVQSFIGMINYLSKFSARLTELAEPIRELVKEKVPFN